MCWLKAESGRELNKEKQTTVILTTHDMADIEQICNRIMMIDHGKKIFDDTLERFKEHFFNQYLISVEFTADEPGPFDAQLKILKEDNHKKQFSFNKEDIGVKEVLVYFSHQFDISDMSIKELEIEEIVRTIYGQRQLSS